MSLCNKVNFDWDISDIFSIFVWTKNSQKLEVIWNYELNDGMFMKIAKKKFTKNISNSQIH